MTHPSVTLVLPAIAGLAGVKDAVAAVGQLDINLLEIVLVTSRVDPDAEDTPETIASHDPRVRELYIPNVGSLSLAVYSGLLAGRGDVLLVIEPQHYIDIPCVPGLLDRLEQETDPGGLVIGYRSPARPGQITATPQPKRFWSTRTKVTQLLLSQKLRDPTSGFFAVRRAALDNRRKRPERFGTRPLLDVVDYCKNGPIVEYSLPVDQATAVPLRVGWQDLWDLVVQRLFLLSGRRVPASVFSFLLVGGLGAGLHFAVLFALLAQNAQFLFAYVAAVVIATAFNYTLNNLLTFGTLAKRGGTDFLSGLLKYYGVTGIGMLANVGAAYGAYELLYGGAVFATFCGVIVDVAWKYSMSRIFIWSR
ncbi:MAG: GtrA family protein [Pseudomonadota bacterium]